MELHLLNQGGIPLEVFGLASYALVLTTVVLRSTMVTLSTLTRASVINKPQ